MNIIVAGGSGTLGRAVVAELLAAGHRVAVVDLATFSTPHPLLTVYDGVDLADMAKVVHAYSEAVIALKSVEGLVNVAGGFVWEPVAQGSIENWDIMYRTNLRTAAVSVNAVVQYLTRGGSIVNVGAAAADRPGSGLAPYAASKAGVMALTESLAEELRGRGIRVNAVLPTIIDTPANRRDMPDTDVSAWVQPGDVAKVIAFLLSPEATAVTGVGIRLSA